MMNDKLLTQVQKDFLLNYLLPSGKALELLLAATAKELGTKTYIQVRSRLVFPLLDLLSLVNCFLLSNKATVADAEKLQVPLKSLEQKLISAVEGCLRTPTQKGRLSIVQGLLTEASEVAQITKLLNYHPSKRMGWIAEMQAVHRTPLSFPRLSKWRTFARHLPWDSFINTLSPEVRPLATPFAAGLEQPGKTGANHAHELWQSGFGTHATPRTTTTLGCAAKYLPASVEVPAETSAPIPASLKIEVCASNTFKLTVCIDPADWMPPSVLQDLKDWGFRNQMLDPLGMTVKCSLGALQSAIVSVSQDYSSRKCLATEKLYEAHAKLAVERLKASVIEKIRLHFSLEERAVLRSLAIEESIKEV